MKNSKVILVAAVTAAFAAPHLALADDGNRRGGMGHGKGFEKLDLNKDGKLTLDESLKNSADRFDKADTNGDGEISLEEMSQRILLRRVERRARRMMKRMDFNGDGKVTKDEIQGRAKKRFGMMDRNDDGVVEKSELRRGKHMRKHHGRTHEKKRHDRQHRQNQNSDDQDL